MSATIKEYLQDLITKRQKEIEKLKLFEEHSNSLQFEEGGEWKDLTDEIVGHFGDFNIDLNIDKVRINTFYLVKTDVGIRILSTEEYSTYMGTMYILYQGSYQACKDFIKV